MYSLFTRAPSIWRRERASAGECDTRRDDGNIYIIIIIKMVCIVCVAGHVGRADFQRGSAADFGAAGDVVRGGRRPLEEGRRPVHLAPPPPPRPPATASLHAPGAAQAQTHQ